MLSASEAGSTLHVVYILFCMDTGCKEVRAQSEAVLAS